MGYTHYWKNKSNDKDNENFLKVVEDAKKLYNNMPATTKTAGGYHENDPLLLGDGEGEGEPIFNDTEIVFNGKGDLGHETFFITTENTEFKFCKTARKPYDLMVCAVLISCKKHLSNFSYSSNGKEDDWKEAHEFYNQVCG
jgi:hypothetical protein